MRRGRKTKREEIKGLNAAHRYVSTFSMKPGAAELAETFCRPVPKERAPRKPSGKPLERDIVREIISALRKHPHVASVQRRQSGVFRDGERWIRVGQVGESDIGGMLHGGRAFEIEVKVPGREPDERQAARIEKIRAAGGIAGCAHSVEEAIALIAPTV